MPLLSCGVTVIIFHMFPLTTIIEFCIYHLWEQFRKQTSFLSSYRNLLPVVWSTKDKHWITARHQHPHPHPRGVLWKKLTGGVRLRFSIGYPWLRKFRSKTCPWLRRISWSWAHFYMILRDFSPNIPIFREIFRKKDVNLAPKCQFLGYFVKTIPLGKDIERKIYPRLRNFCQKNTLG